MDDKIFLILDGITDWLTLIVILVFPIALIVDVAIKRGKSWKR